MSELDLDINDDAGMGFMSPELNTFCQYLYGKLSDFPVARDDDLYAFLGVRKSASSHRAVRYSWTEFRYHLSRCAKKMDETRRGVARKYLEHVYHTLLLEPNRMVYHLQRFPEVGYSSIPKTAIIDKASVEHLFWVRWFAWKTFDRKLWVDRYGLDDVEKMDKQFTLRYQNQKLEATYADGYLDKRNEVRQKAKVTTPDIKAVESQWAIGASLRIVNANGGDSTPSSSVTSKRKARDAEQPPKRTRSNAHIGLRIADRGRPPSHLDVQALIRFNRNNTLQGSRNDEVTVEDDQLSVNTSDAGTEGGDVNSDDEESKNTTSASAFRTGFTSNITIQDGNVTPTKKSARDAGAATPPLPDRKLSTSIIPRDHWPPVLRSSPLLHCVQIWSSVLVTFSKDSNADYERNVFVYGGSNETGSHWWAWMPSVVKSMELSLLQQMLEPQHALRLFERFQGTQFHELMFVRHDESRLTFVTGNVKERDGTTSGVTATVKIAAVQANVVE
jgi:hypothetical protein